jgi:hypothetical protein
MEHYLNNICFYGASIINQPKGIVHYFKKINPNKNVTSFAYGGTQITDAGVCHINTVAHNSSDFCFIDWFSAQMPIAPSWDYLEACMDTIVTKLLKVDCLPIFLFMYRVDDIKNPILHKKRRQLYDDIKNYCHIYNIDYIDLTQDSRVIQLHEKGLLLLDTSHVTEQGASAYAEIVTEHFNNSIVHKNIAKNILPQSNELSNIKEIRLLAQITGCLKIYGNGKIFGIQQHIGPHSGILNINSFDKNNSLKINCWDKYCFYQRKVISRIDYDFKKWVAINVSQEEFDKSSSQQPVGIFESQKMIKCLSIFHIGEIEKISVE